MAKILLIDDSEDVHSLLYRALSPLHEVFCVFGWAAANPYLFRDKMDLVLIDINMPGVKGDQIAGILQETALNEKFNIVLFSAMDEGELRKKAKNLGVGYLQKVFEKEILQGAIENCLKKKRA